MTSLSRTHAFQHELFAASGVLTDVFLTSHTQSVTEDTEVGSRACVNKQH